MTNEPRGLFWENASELLDAAVAASGLGNATPNMTVLINWQGGIHLIADSDWPLERLAEDRGARTAYRVQHDSGRIAVEGRQAGSTCRLETESAARRYQHIFRDSPRYSLAEPAPEHPAQ